MNFFTDRFGYCLFPRSTLILQETFRTMPITKRVQSALAKYCRRGWYPVNQTHDPACHLSPRHCNDSFTWKIERTGWTNNLQSNTADIGSWRMISDFETAPHKLYYGVFDRKELNYSYVISNGWFEFAIKSIWGPSGDIVRNLHHGDGIVHK